MRIYLHPDGIGRYTDTKLAYLTWTWQHCYVSGHILMWKCPSSNVDLALALLYLALSWPASALNLGTWPYHDWGKARRLNALPYFDVRVALSSHRSSLMIIVPNLILTWTSSQTWPYANMKVALSSYGSRLLLMVPGLKLTWTWSPRWVPGLILFCKQPHPDRNLVSFPWSMEFFFLIATSRKEMCKCKKNLMLHTNG